MSTEKEKEAIKEATTNAIIALEGCKYFLATIVDEKERKFFLHQDMSFNQLALAIKGILSQNKMLMMDVLQWCSLQVQEELERKKRNN